ncbi:MAG: putative toxin-antitoxin system toxin component, PIN family [Chloroflexi bacterium]|nr:putative toxin-antitoxin system toxin component, PIN family [Chloroflexota bacterium]
MIAVTVDANVVASGFVRPQSIPDAVLRAWLADLFTLMLSDPLIDEVERTLDPPYFAQRLTRTQRAANVALLRSRAVITLITVEVHGVTTHPEDDLVLAAAVSGHAAYLVTGDKKLQRLGAYEGVTILSPRRFVDEILPHINDR